MDHQSNIRVAIGLRIISSSDTERIEGAENPSYNTVYRSIFIYCNNSILTMSRRPDYEQRL